MNLLGSSSNNTSSQTLTNTLSFNPIMNIGDSNDAKTGFDAQTRADSTATTSNKDEFGLSSGVALGSGASASGGPVGVGDDVQPTEQQAAKTSVLSGLAGNTPAMIFGVVVIIGIVAAITASSRKKGN
ncbi:hypothetical protein WCX49_06690 [Sulfurimonas sp. HSL-1656]|uniref:hypothetical protein n=1 Tax=Thiomicrolovo subterrani TaxID=3131934 RepID=UPI0031F8282A